MFIGRQQELRFLENKYKNAEGQLLVVYGRRRVGKTEILRRFCDNKEGIFFTCTEIPDEQLLRSFSQRLLEKNQEAAKYITSFGTWEQALQSLGDIKTTTKLVIVIDEFPYMARGNSAIPSILQKVWDETLKYKNIMLILGGSAMSFMEKEVLSEKNPLYGRATGILKIQAMDFFDAAKFFPHYSIDEKIQAYAILGGIPHYLKQFDSSISIAENIKNNILTKGSVLYSEVEFLMRQELRETSIYNAIIEAIALGNTKLNDIYQKTQIDKSKLSVYLKNLLDLGIIAREFSVATSVKERANNQRGLYKLTDNFFRFWYAFVFPNLSELEAGYPEGVYNYIVAPDLDQYTSFAYEDVCRQYLRMLNHQGKLPFYASSLGRWWDKNTEIDILAMDRTQQNLLLCECKYRNSPVDVKDIKHLQAKKPYNALNIFYYFFSKSGYTQAAKAFAQEQGSVILNSLEELKSTAGE